MKQININDYLKYLESHWSPRSIKKLKVKLFAKGLIDECPCDKCEAQDVVSPQPNKPYN